MAEGPEEHGSAVASSAGEPGPLSRLLQELAGSSGEDALEAWKHEFQPGDRIGRFEIRREVGRGGFGAVYEAFDAELSRVVAVKTLRLSRPRRDLSLGWLKKEAEAVARLDHPCIVTLFDVGTCASGPYLVMELLRGQTLAQRIAEGPIPWGEALRISEEVAKGLAHAHQRGVLHRDLKPANVFLCDDGRVKLLDFGLAHLLGTQELRGAGTPGYMAPEQARGDEVDQRADVYAAGRVLGAMLLEPRPRRLDLAFRAATASDPDARPRDGTAWLEALRAARRALERPARARRLALFAGAFVVLGVVAAGLVTWRVWRKQLLVGDDGRVTVAVADFANETRDPDLDGLSGLLVHSLEQSRTARVLTRSRLLDLARAEGRADAERMDEPLAREIGRKGDVRVLLLASVRKLDDTYVVEMRALDPTGDEYLFTAREKAASKSEMVPLVERLAKRTLESFRQAGAVADTGAGPTPAVTTSLEAYRHYFEGMRCLDRSSGPSQKCIPQLEKAVAIDPDFALAHFRIAQAGLWSGVPLATLKERMTSALRHRERLPPKERAWVEAFSAQLDGREDEAARLFRVAADVGLDDRHVQADAADFFQTRNEPEAALPYLRRAVALESVGGPSAIYLAIALAALDRRDDLGALARVLETGPQVKGALVALTAVRYSLGDRRGALASARAAVAASTDDVERGEAEDLLHRLRVVMGDPGVDAETRATCSTIESAIVETVRGRHAEARRLLALGAIPGCPPPDAERAGKSFYFQALAADLLAGNRRPGGRLAPRPEGGGTEPSAGREHRGAAGLRRRPGARRGARGLAPRWLTPPQDVRRGRSMAPGRSRRGARDPRGVERLLHGAPPGRSGVPARRAPLGDGRGRARGRRAAPVPELLLRPPALRGLGPAEELVPARALPRPPRAARRGPSRARRAARRLEGRRPGHPDARRGEGAAGETGGAVTGGGVQR